MAVGKWNSYGKWWTWNTNLEAPKNAQKQSQAEKYALKFQWWHWWLLKVSFVVWRKKSCVSSSVVSAVRYKALYGEHQISEAQYVNCKQTQKGPIPYELSTIPKEPPLQEKTQQISHVISSSLTKLIPQLILISYAAWTQFTFSKQVQIVHSSQTIIQYYTSLKWCFGLGSLLSLLSTRTNIVSTVKFCLLFLTRPAG